LRRLNRWAANPKPSREVTKVMVLRILIVILMIFMCAPGSYGEEKPEKAPAKQEGG
jgi:hypothetical protein